MKLLLENWNKFLTEGGVPETVWPPGYLENLEIDEDGNVNLYHVSKANDIEYLDPQIAVRNINRYTNAEYRAWDRPRVFYFTRCGQQDRTIGDIPGTCSYVVKVPLNQLYPVYPDPLDFLSDENKVRYKDIRFEKSGRAKYYPINTFETVATLSEEDYNVKGFIYPQGGDMNNLIAILWTKEPVQKREDDFYK